MNAPLALDIVVPTYNRAALLERLLASLFSATQPESLTWRVTVADNRSTDGTRSLVERYRDRFPSQVAYCYAPEQGRSNALNTGIAATTGDLVGCLDDDEEIQPHWLTVVEREFRDPTLDFIGGPYLPRFEIPPPPWIDNGYPAVIGKVSGPDQRTPFGPAFAGILMGGNAVLRRSVLLRVGGYRTDLGRSGSGRLMSGEDRALYGALLSTGARGYWIPDLIIDHFVPVERLQRRYHWRWAFDHAISMARFEGAEHGGFGAVPRWRYGVLVRRTLPALLHPDLTARMRAQMDVLDTLGYLRGVLGG
jgi:glycosyltransferase involved in cell wall biosynthesis